MSFAQVVNVAGQIGNLAPGLGALVAIVDSIHGTVTTMKRNKEQCIRLQSFCSSIVTTINSSFKENDVADDAQLAAALNEMLKAFEATQDDIKKIASYSIWDSVTKQDRIKQIISDRRVALTDTFTIFGLTSQLQLQRWNLEFAKAAEQDRSLVMQAVEIVQRTDNKVETLTIQQQRQFEMLEMNRPTPPPPPVHLPRTQSLHTTDMESALRLLQIRLRMVSAEAEPTLHSSIESTLRDLQRTSGGAPLPLADLCGEARKIGNAPVHYSATAEIWQGVWLGDSTRMVALKCLRAAVPMSQNAIKRFHRQVELVRSVQHPNIIQLYGVSYVDGPNMYLVFPWMKHGDVSTYLTSHPHADRMKLMLDVACGLRHLHSQAPPMVHSGLQPSNILVDDTHTAIVADFGLAKALNDLDANGANYTLSNGAQVSMRWMAPELSDALYGTPADVYAWGMTALQVLSGLQPFYRIKQPGRVVISVHQGKRPERQDYPDECISEQFWNLLERCWRHEPQERPRMDEVVHEILQMRPELAARA